MATREEDIRASVLDACHRVGLYDQINDPNGASFLDRPANELVVAAEDTCPLGPPYSAVMMTFREAIRSGLRQKGYTDVTIFLQRLCSTKSPSGDAFTWRDFSKWHVPQVAP